MTSLTLFAHPWDIQTQGVGAFVAEAKSLGLTDLYVSTAYHSAEILTPRGTAGAVVTADANKAHLPLPASAFSDLRIEPSRTATDSPGLFAELAAECANVGLGLNAWIVAFHNSSLATRQPHAAMVNCFGDVNTHGLCPANPASRTYLLELVRAVQQTGHFARSFVESMSYIPHGHGHPHGVPAARLDPTTRFMLSLCFCASCTERAHDLNIDTDSLRAWLACELRRTWNSRLSPWRQDDDGKELASVLVQRPDLFAFTRMRMDVVDGLTTEVAATVQGTGSALDVCSAVWSEPSALNFVEGIDVGHTMSTADRYVACSYYNDPAEVARDLDHALAVGDSGKLGMALLLFPDRHQGLSGLVQKVDLAGSVGVSDISLYSYSTATDATLRWVGEVADCMELR